MERRAAALQKGNAGGENHLEKEAEGEEEIKPSLQQLQTRSPGNGYLG